MVTWRQLKVREGKRHIGRKAKWFNAIENEILEDKKTRVIKEEYKEKKGFQVQEIKKKISRDKRKKECVLIEGKENRESKLRRIIRKEKKIVEVEIWKEDCENIIEEDSQQRIYQEGFKLKKDSQRQRVALKEVYNISNFIRKKDNVPCEMPC